MALTRAGRWIVPVPAGHYEEKRTPNGGTSRTWVPEPPKQIEMQIEIDWAKLASALGQKAAKAKGRKSQLLGGIIVATDLSRGGKR